jgi:hypothetical protein
LILEGGGAALGRSAEAVVVGVLVARQEGPFGQASYLLEFNASAGTIAMTDAISAPDRTGVRGQLVLAALERDTVNPDPVGQALHLGLEIEVIAYSGTLPWGPMPLPLRPDHDLRLQGVRGKLRRV